MASNGRLSIFAQSFPTPAKRQWAPARRLVSGLCAIAALIAVAALNALPLPVFFLAVAAGLCLLLVPYAPLAMLLVLLVLSPARTLIATEADIQLPLDIGQILLALYLGLWLANSVVKRRQLPKLNPEPVFLSAFALCLVFAIGAWTSESIGNWLTEWLKWVIIAFMIWHLSRNARSNWFWLVFAVLISALANAVVGIYIFFGGSGADHLLILGRFFRAFGTFGQPNPFGGFMGIALPLALAYAALNAYQILLDLLAGRRIAHLRIISLGAAASLAAIIAAALFASWSRGAWLGFALSLVAMLVALPRRLVTGLGCAIVLAALFWAMWSAGLLPPSVVNRLTATASDLFTVSDVRGYDFTPANYAVVERLAHWQAAISMAQDHPFFGLGLGNYAGAYADYRLLNWEDPLGHAHNLYLNVLAESGAVGLAAFIAFWITVFRLSWRARSHPDRSARAVAVGLIGCWTYIGVHSAFDNLFVNNLFLHIGVLLSVLAILHRQVTASLELD